MMVLVFWLIPIISKSTPNLKTHGHIVSTTLYHPTKKQCSGNPLITADGSKINMKKLQRGEIRWIAVSRDLLKHYSFGDTIVVVSDNKKFSGKWVIHDTMNSRFKRKIDFLMHPNSEKSTPKKVTIFHAKFLENPS